MSLLIIINIINSTIMKVHIKKKKPNLTLLLLKYEILITINKNILMDVIIT